MYRSGGRYKISTGQPGVYKRLPSRKSLLLVRHPYRTLKNYLALCSNSRGRYKYCRTNKWIYNSIYINVETFPLSSVRICHTATKNIVPKTAKNKFFQIGIQQKICWKGKKRDSLHELNRGVCKKEVLYLLVNTEQLTRSFKKEYKKSKSKQKSKSMWWDSARDLLEIACKQDFEQYNCKLSFRLEKNFLELVMKWKWTRLKRLLKCNCR